MSAGPVTRTIITTGLDAAYRHALAAMLPVAGDADDGSVQMFAGEGESPGAALADAVGAIRELLEMRGGTPARVTHHGALRTDDGYRLWGTLTIIEGEAAAIPPMEARIEAGEEGTWTVTITRS